MRELYRQFKKIIFPINIIASKDVLINVFKQLPDDAELVESYSFPDALTHHLIFSSKEWDSVPHLSPIPVLDIDYSVKEVVLPQSLAVIPKEPEVKIQSNVCICDFEYTGLRSHKKSCPMNR